jgi:hypothetical protein
MSGISRIQETRDSRGQGPSGVPGREIWFKDGDQAFITALATGDPEDPYLDELYMYTYNSGSRWVNLLDDPDVDTSDVPANTRSSHKFAFWGYVHEIIHNERRNDDWEAVGGPGGKKMFKETVEDWRIISLTFGRSDYIWNQLADVYNDWNGLNKGVMRIKRTGTGMFDTSYQIAGTTRKGDVPEDSLSQVEELPSIKEYFKGRYGGTYSPNGTTEGVTSLTDTSTDDLF